MITKANPHQYVVLLLHINLVLQLSMSIQVGHAHRLIIHLSFPHSLVIAQTMGIMFLPKVKMNILTPKLMFRFWLRTQVIMVMMIIILPWIMKILIVMTVPIRMAII